MMMGEPRTHIIDERIHCLPPPESFNTNTQSTDNIPQVQGSVMSTSTLSTGSLADLFIFNLLFIDLTINICIGTGL